jgi:membrane-associated protease RseP (regulator of RpoE activity)
MGFLAIVAGLTLLIVLHELGHWAVAQWRGMQAPVFSIGFGSPYIVLFRWRGTEFRLTPWLLGGYVALPEMADETTVKDYLKESGQDPSSFKQYKIWERSAVAVAGVVMNVLTALVLSFILFAFVGMPDHRARDAYIAGLSSSNTIARDAGLQSGDIVVSVDGQPVRSPQDLIKLVSAHKGTPAEFVVSRGGQTVAVTVTPDQDGRIGIAIGAHIEKRYKQVGVGEAGLEALKFNGDMTWQMFRGLGMMLHIIPAPKELPAGATDVHGFVAIVQVGNMAYNDGLYSFVLMLVLLSMNLAIFNILPIPLLDGGYLLFFAIEAIRGKPLRREVQQSVLFVFFVLLIGLMLFGLFNDIFNPIDFGK